MSGIVHLAGNPISIGNEVVQRCMWCGKALVEENITRVAIQCEPGQEDVPQELPTWSFGHFIEVDGGMTSDVGEADPGLTNLPLGGCWQ